MNLAESQLAQRFRESGMSSFCDPNGSLSAKSNKIPRNAPCPCPIRCKIQKMLRRSGRRGPGTRPRSPLKRLESGPRRTAQT